MFALAPSIRPASIESTVFRCLRRERTELHEENISVSPSASHYPTPSLSLSLSLSLVCLSASLFLPFCLSLGVAFSLHSLALLYISVRLSVSQSVCLFACLPACLPACLSACLPVCLFLSVFHWVSLALQYFSVCLFVCLSTCLFASLSACLSVYLLLSVSESVNCTVLVELVPHGRGLDPKRPCACSTTVCLSDSVYV